MKIEIQIQKHGGEMTMRSTLTPKMVDHAEDMCDAIEEAIHCLEGAIEALKGSKDGTLIGYADDLSGYLDDLKDENEPYEAILTQNYEEEQEALLRDYWRSVV